MSINRKSNALCYPCFVILRNGPLLRTKAKWSSGGKDENCIDLSKKATQYVLTFFNIWFYSTWYYLGFTWVFKTWFLFVACTHILCLNNFESNGCML